MKNVMKIFTRDVKNLIKSPLAFIIAIGVCILPALYAWFNIYSNWDPYANTANIKIAAASDDLGYTDADGNYKNNGDSVLENLKENTSIDWVILENSQDAIDGVYSGEYYAAVVINSDFSYCMYNFFDNGFKNPTFTYYENEKKNAIATKITDTAVGSLKTNINANFINVVASTIFEETGNVSEDVKDSEAMSSLYDKLVTLRENLNAYNTTIDLFLNGNDALTEELNELSESLRGTNASIVNATASFESAQNSLSSTRTTLDSYATQVTNTLNSVIAALNDLSATLTQTSLAADTEAALNSLGSVSGRINTINNQINTLSNTLLKAKLDGYQGNYDDALATLLLIKTSVNQIGNAISAVAAANSGVAGNIASAQITATLSATVNSINSASAQVANTRNTIVNDLIPQLTQLLNSMSDMFDNVISIMDSLNSTLNDMDTIFTCVDSAITETGSTLNQVKDSIGEILEKLDTVIEWMDSLDDDERLNMVTSFLGGDSESYGKFFAEPVTVTTKQIYPVETYGCAVTPFYTILALWVGGTILVSIIKVKVNPEGLEAVTPSQLFFGRYLLFFVLGQLQAIIIAAGDILLLKCQVLHTGMFFVAAMLASFTFTLFIYALTISFGDIGKALAVIIMVLQIAGSSGTFPIELLPEFNQKIYIFFPFPYAINAMRETVAGLYGMYYAENLVKLMLFAVASLVIGLVIRIPFMKLNHYVEERMEDTKMM